MNWSLCLLCLVTIVLSVEAITTDGTRLKREPQVVNGGLVGALLESALVKQNYGYGVYGHRPPYYGHGSHGHGSHGHGSHGHHGQGHGFGFGGPSGHHGGHHSGHGHHHGHH